MDKHIMAQACPQCGGTEYYCAYCAEEAERELAECREAVDALGPGGAGWKEYYERSVDAWRGEDEMHESGERCARCDRLATVRGYPYCTVCFLEYQVASLQNEWRLALEHAAQVAEDQELKAQLAECREKLAAAQQRLRDAEVFVGFDGDLAAALEQARAEERERAKPLFDAVGQVVGEGYELSDRACDALWEAWCAYGGGGHETSDAGADEQQDE